MKLTNTQTSKLMMLFYINMYLLSATFMLGCSENNSQKDELIKRDCKIIELEKKINYYKYMNDSLIAIIDSIKSDTTGKYYFKQMWENSEKYVDFLEMIIFKDSTKLYKSDFPELIKMFPEKYAKDLCRAAVMYQYRFVSKDYAINKLKIYTLKKLVIIFRRTAREHKNVRCP